MIAERFAAQLLSGEPAGSAEAVVRRLLAVQGQDPRGARLAIRARSAGLTAADVDRALTVDRSLLLTWLNRGTLHLIATEDYWWLHALTTPPLRSVIARRLAQENVPPDEADKGVAVIEAALARDGPLTRQQLAERIAAAGVRTQGQALVYLLFLASSRGICVRGPMIGPRNGPDHGYVLVRDWLGTPPDPVDRDVALAELARRYLAGHGPASDRDLARWVGLPLRDARRGLTAIAGELRERDDGLAELATRESGDHQPLVADQAALPPPRLLGPFDPVLLGWTSREPILGAYQGIVTTNGVFRPFALVAGRAVGTWSLAAGRVSVTPFDPLPEPVKAALQTDAADVIRFLGELR